MSQAPVDVEPEFAARVVRAARSALGPLKLTSLEVLAGGNSGVTHVAAFERTDGSAQPVVIKSAPPGREPVGRHDVLRQAAIMAKLHGEGRVPVPGVLFAVASPPPFFGMELCGGRASDPVVDEPDIEAPPARVVARAWNAAVELLAALHTRPVDDLLDGNPPRDPATELGTWKATLAAAHAEDLPGARALTRALASSVPDPARAGIVHGDFRLGNILMSDGRPTAIIDWEIWSLGDPATDLGWLLAFAEPDNFPGFGRQIPGTPTPEAIVDRYLALVPRPRASVDWFLALGVYKLAAVQAHNLQRHREGRYTAPSLERWEASIPRLLERGLEHLATAAS